MRVHFWIPGPLRSMSGGQSHVDVDTCGGTLGDALDGLFAAYPGIRDRILTEQREIRQHVNLFVGKKEARTLDGLATPVANGTEVSILPAISGGCKKVPGPVSGPFFRKRVLSQRSRSRNTR